MSSSRIFLDHRFELTADACCGLDGNHSSLGRSRVLWFLASFNQSSAQIGLSLMGR